MNYRGVTKIRKPYTNSIDQLLTHDSTYINNRSAGIYIAKKIKNELKDMLGIHPVKRDAWVLYKKCNFKKFCEGSKYDFYKKD